MSKTEMTRKNINTLVKDIYKYLESYTVVTPEQCAELALILSQVLTEKLSSYRKPSLSMSCMGHPVRKLKLEIEKPVKPSGKQRLRFLYGDILEAVVLWLAKQAGHTVEAQQDAVTLDKVTGHIDAIIDGDLVDVKSCSPQSFKKFEQGTLPSCDPFGYLAQISSYKECKKTPKAHFLAVDKVSGDLTLYTPDADFDLPDPHKIVERARTAFLAKSFTDLPVCEEPVPVGKSGNMKLTTGCRLCTYRDLCWPKAVKVQYSTGPEYFTKIVKEPKVKRKN